MWTWLSKRHDPAPAIKARIEAERDLEQRRAEGNRIDRVIAEFRNIATAFEANFRGGRR